MSARRSGPTAVEYAVVLALVLALAAAGVMAALGVGAGDVLRGLGNLVGLAGR